MARSYAHSFGLPVATTRQWVDSSRLRALTGWHPTLSLEEGLARTVAWYRSHPGVLG